MFLMSLNNLIDKHNIDSIFSSLAEEYIKLGGIDPVNIYLVGGAAIVLNFEYRLSTIDIDAYYVSNQTLKQAIDIVSKTANLPSDWLNDDFVNTPSYSQEIVEKAKLHSSHSNIIYVYALEPKYMIAMKLKSSRPTSGDLDDVIKMIYELRFKEVPITYEEIIEAYQELYSDFSNTYDYFLQEAKEAFKTPVEDFEYMFKGH